MQDRQGGVSDQGQLHAVIASATDCNGNAELIKWSIEKQTVLLFSIESNREFQIECRDSIVTTGYCGEQFGIPYRHKRFDKIVHKLEKELQNHCTLGTPNSHTETKGKNNSMTERAYRQGIQYVNWFPSMILPRKQFSTGWESLWSISYYYTLFNKWTCSGLWLSGALFLHLSSNLLTASYMSFDRSRMSTNRSALLSLSTLRAFLNSRSVFSTEIIGQGHFKGQNRYMIMVWALHR